MKQIQSVNQTVPAQEEELEAAIADLLSREELICTGHVCAADAGFL